MGHYVLRGVYDVDKEGEGHLRFHPDGLPKRDTLLPLSELEHKSDLNKHAQRRYSCVVHHSAWLQHVVRLQGVSRRDLVRFVAVSQPQAGAFLNAVPKFKDFEVHTWALRVALRRRLGLPLATAAAAAQQFSRHGLRFDAYGDVATNDGEAGHQTRHYELLQALVKVVKSVYGGLAQREPVDYRDYSDKRPDFSVRGAGKGGELLAGELKFTSPVGSDGVPGLRGAAVAFGNTEPPVRKLTHGLRERGHPSDGSFNPRTGRGYVAAVEGEYHRAEHVHGVDVRCLLFEVFGGWCPTTVAFFAELAEQRQNKLRKDEFDVTTWAARTWLSFAAQKVSVALHVAAAYEVVHALGLSAAVCEETR